VNTVMNLRITLRNFSVSEKLIVLQEKLSSMELIS
jgi:hypothetical protein